MTPPFVTVDLHLKQVRFADLNPEERKSLTYFFPGYAGKGFTRAEIEEGLLKEAQARGFAIVEDQTLPRRFAGDHSLPRSRYYSVCRDETGNDGGTLRNELRAYARHDESGFFATIDSTGTDADAVQARTLLQPGHHALLCIPRDTPAFPTPYGKLVGLDRRTQRQMLIAVVPLSVTRQQIDRVIDLRRPEVQTWFTTHLTRLHDPTTKTPCFPMAGRLGAFTQLLPALLSQSLGDGRRVTQIAGIWLRNLGAHAVIFPSARSNARTTVTNGELTDWSGWNLVDYREAPPPVIAGACDLSPHWEEYPLFGGNLPLTGEGVPPIVYDRTRIAQIATGPEAGSLRVEGIVEQREPYHTLATWMYFVRRLNESFPALQAERLTQLFVDLSQTESGTDLEKLARLTAAACGTLFGGQPPRQALLQVMQELQRLGRPEDAERLGLFLQTSDALNRATGNNAG